LVPAQRGHLAAGAGLPEAHLVRLARAVFLSRPILVLVIPARGHRRRDAAQPGAPPAGGAGDELAVGAERDRVHAPRLAAPRPSGSLGGSHNLTVQPPPALASCLPSGRKATSRTGPLWPRSQNWSCPE